MKNIHVLPTDKPSRLYLFEERLILGDLVTVVFKNSGAVNQNIYITSDEEIKRGDWYFAESLNEILQYTHDELLSPSELKENGDKKIILTTDLQLIADGVQAIDDEFIEWFIKNPSCEKVEVDLLKRGIYEEYKYKIIIPKEEPKLDLEKEMFELEQELDIPSHLRWHNSKPKQETLEEADENKKNLYFKKQVMNPYPVEGYSYTAYEKGFREGYEESNKYQQEQDKNKYSEEEVFNLLMNFWMEKRQEFKTNPVCVANWFDQFKKK